MSLSETRMIARALMQRWPIKPEYRDALVRSMLRILADPSSKPRERTAAAKALLAAEGQNQADEHKAVDVHVSTRHDRLDAIAADLGIEIHLIEDATGKAGSGVASVEIKSNVEPV